jgi:CTP synthase
VTLVPFLGTTGEFKTKPTQHSVKELRSIGILPEIIVCRSREPLTLELREKISLFCDTAKEAVIGLMDVPSIYAVPLALEEEKLAEIVLKYLKISSRKGNLNAWREMLGTMNHAERVLNIAIVGKYTQLSDSYISIIEALKHGGILNNARINVVLINSEQLESEQNLEPIFRDVHGVVVPGGFGPRGIEGKIKAINYARVNRLPFLGLCLGMHCAVVEFARSVLGFKGANSTEFDENTKYPVIDLLPEQKKIKEKGGTMRLGAYTCKIKKNTLLHESYRKTLIRERHRHRFEFNNKYKDEFAARGMTLSGINPEANLVEVVELRSHPWFLATQFHPEFKSRPNRPHPLFKSFVAAATLRLKEQEKLF